ncbi:MAG: NAD(P)/FAD-dependent oxidoreductase [Alphaproteobacteria bacterium]
MEKTDCVVIGGGVIGLAIARRLAMDGREVIVLEGADAIGTVTSARNSEVIHGGLYYPTASLKARLCVEGKAMLYDFLERRGLAHQRCGKLIVAADESQLPALRQLQDKATNNGVDDLQWLTADEARALEPDLACSAALLSPSTGILDSHAYMLALQGEAENHGATIAFLSTVSAGKVTDDGIILSITSGGEQMHLQCASVVNSAGLGAQDIACAIEGMPPALVPRQYLSKGCYFTLTGKAPFERLVYPLPEKAGLGIHYTRDLGGQGRFGPDTEWVDKIDYGVAADRADGFYASIRRYWPGLPDAALSPGYAGIRPKLQAPGEDPADFVIQGPDEHGVRGLVNLFGIESPGLTASLAIADLVAAKLSS